MITIFCGCCHADLPLYAYTHRGDLFCRDCSASDHHHADCKAEGLMGRVS